MSREYLDILNRMTAWELREFLKPDVNGRAPTLPMGFDNRRRRLAEVATLTAAETDEAAASERMRITAVAMWGEPEQWGPRRPKRRNALVTCNEQPGRMFTVDEAAAIVGVSRTGIYSRLNRGGVTVRGVTYRWADDEKERVA